MATLTTEQVDSDEQIIARMRAALAHRLPTLPGGMLEDIATDVVCAALVPDLIEHHPPTARPVVLADAPPGVDPGDLREDDGWISTSTGLWLKSDEIGWHRVSGAQLRDREIAIKHPGVPWCTIAVPDDQIDVRDGKFYLLGAADLRP